MTEPIHVSPEAAPATIPIDTLQSPTPLLTPGVARPTYFRHVIVGAVALAAFLMYLDRNCMSQMVASKSFKVSFGLSKVEVGGTVSLFYVAYALAQMPAGWLADRFRLRPLMACLIAVWSGFTFVSGFATGFWSLIWARIGCGVAEAGAYPLSGKTVPRWVPFAGRGTANGIISAGGRLGGAVAPALTAMIIALFGTWRAAGWIFGIAGFGFALIFWYFFRDRPAEHPRVNAGELNLIGRNENEAKPIVRETIASPGADAHPGIPLIAYLTFGPLIFPLVDLASRVRTRIPWTGLLCSRDMWLMCYYQWLTNIAWAFLPTLMPIFLTERGLTEQRAGTYSSIAMFTGIVGMLIGGWLTDVLTQKFGTRRGRMIPLVWSRVIGAAAYFLVLRFDSPWACVAAFGTVAAMTDLSIPATWGYIQDVGGRNIAAAFAWPNMWGNLGAAMTANLLVWINAHFDPNHNWHVSMAFLAVIFLLSGIAALGIRADIPIGEEGVKRRS